jgi:hypothetical protein
MDHQKETQQTMSYASVAQKMQFPKKEQAIVLDAIDGISIREYTLSIGNKVGPCHIRYVSRISQGRICIYLSSEEQADKLNQETVKIGNHILEIRPLITKSKRIIISNVCPIIPHSVLESKLNELNIKTTSRITSIRAGINEPGYAHILSFRRQVYVNPEDTIKLPESMQINFDNTLYWIYFSTEKLTCFICKEEGHLAKYCKTTGNNEPHAVQLPDSLNVPKVLTSLSLERENTLQEDELAADIESDNSIINKDTPIGSKRPLTSPTDISSVEFEFEDTVKNNAISRIPALQQTPKKPKKSKKVSTEDTNALLLPAKEHVESNRHRFPIDYETLLSFLVKTHGNPNTEMIANEFTTDIEALNNMLTEIYSHLKERSIKSRITRIKKRLSNPQLKVSSEDISSLEGQEEQ